MVIEFLGLPGVGKTYITKKLSDAMDQSDERQLFSYDHTTFFHKIACVFYFVLRNLRIVFYLLLLATSNRKNKVYASTRALKTILFLVNYQKNMNGKRNVNILDQGVMQAIWSICSYTEEPEFNSLVMAKLVRLLARKYNHHVIFLQRDIPDIIRQLKMRPFQNTIFETINDKELYGRYKIQEGVFFTILSSLSKDRYSILSTCDYESTDKLVEFIITNIIGDKQ